MERRHWAGQEGGGSAAGRHALTDSRPHPQRADLGLVLSLSQIIPLLTPGTQTPLSVPASRSTAVSGSSPNGPPPGSLSRPL